MKKRIIFLIIVFIGSHVYSQNIEKNISGIISDANGPLDNVNIYIKGESTGIISDSKGHYSIQVKSGSILVFSSIGFQTQEVKIKRKTSVLNIQLLPKVEKLNEVVLKKRRAKTQKELLEEYPRNKRLIKTSLGIVDKDRASFPIRIIDGNDLIPVGRDFLYSLQNLDLRIKVDRTHNPKHHIDQPRVYLRYSDSTAIFDVDGIIYHQTPTFVDVTDIDRVSILVGSGAIGRYGTEGVGGVIIINTKSTNTMQDMGVKRTYDNSDLRDSISEVLIRKDETIAKYPNYIKEYLPVTSEGKAFEIFQQQRLQYADSVYYFIDVMDYFKSIWDNPKTSQQILGSVSLDSLSNISDLKALAYKYEALGDYENALGCYLKIRKLKPADAQSHRDVANSYAQIGDFKKGFKTYARYKVAIDKIENRDLGVNETEKIMDAEMNNIIAVNSKDFSFKKSRSKENKNIAARLLFEWSNDQAEFDLEFINPKQKYNSWQNSKSKQGAKQFFLDNALKGEWKVKINYRGSVAETPTYLKITTYFDFGKPSQSSHIMVYRFKDEVSNLTVLKIDTKQEQVIQQKMY